jgi:hypothetical protein
MFVLYTMPADLPTGLSLSAAAASHAGDAQNEHLNNDDEEEAPPRQRRRVGTSRRDMPLAANDALEGEGGVDDVDDGKWMGSIDPMEEVDEEDEKQKADDDEEEEQGGGYWEQWCCQGEVSWLWMMLICLLIFYLDWRG